MKQTLFCLLLCSNVALAGAGISHLGGDELTWENSSTPVGSWSEAHDYCENKARAERSTWRLPSKDELLYLCCKDTSSNNRRGQCWSSDPRCQHAREVLGDGFSEAPHWASTCEMYDGPVFARRETHCRHEAWYVSLSNGGADYKSVHHGDTSVRCVRGN